MRVYVCVCVRALMWAKLGSSEDSVGLCSQLLSPRLTLSRPLSMETWTWAWFSVVLLTSKAYLLVKQNQLSLGEESGLMSNGSYWGLPHCNWGKSVIDNNFLNESI